MVLFDGRCQKLIDIIILLEKIEYPVNAKNFLVYFDNLGRIYWYIW